MSKEDFTEEELKLLKAIFEGAETIAYIMRYDRYDVDLINTLYDLKEKLGIIEVLK